MPTFITIPAEQGDALVNVDHIVAISHRYRNGGTCVEMYGHDIFTSLTPTEVLDLIHAATTPGTETR